MSTFGEILSVLSGKSVSFKFVWFQSATRMQILTKYEPTCSRFWSRG